MNPKEATFAIYRDQSEIKVAMHSLIKLGFARSDISTFQSKAYGDKDFSQVLLYQLRNGAIAGAIVGAVLGSVFFMVVGGHLLGSHLLVMIVDSLLGGLVGAVCGTLVGIATPSPPAKRHGQYLQSGGILLSVHSDTAKQIDLAQAVLTATGGQDIHLINEINTWETANLERMDREKN